MLRPEYGAFNFTNRSEVVIVAQSRSKLASAVDESINTVERKDLSSNTFCWVKPLPTQG
jgi:hypothetical protein